MLAIVAGHSIIHAGQEYPALTGNGLFAVALTQGSRIGVDLFMFITGYFSVGKKINTEKLIKQYFQIWTYSVLISFGLALSGIIALGLKSAVRILLPVSSSQYWFATTYFLIVLASPLLQAAIAGMGQKEYRRVLFIFFVLWCALPTFYIASPGFNEFTWLVYIWLLAAYLRKYPVRILNEIRVWHGLLCFGAIVTAALFTYIFGYHIYFFHENAIYIYAQMNKIPAVLCTLLLFYGFHNWKIPSSRLIIFLAPLTFGIYLFHDNPNIRSFLWREIFSASLDDPWFVVRKTGSILAVFAIGAAIEFVRRQISDSFEKKTSLAKRLTNLLRD